MIVRAFGLRFEVPDWFVSVAPDPTGDGASAASDPAGPGGTERPAMAVRVLDEGAVPVVAPEPHFDVDQAVAARLDGDVLSVWALQELGPLTVEHFALDHMIPTALGMAGHTVVHGSGVELAGRGVVLAGSSGAGKSTLALWLASHGWGWLGDDAILLSPATTGVRHHLLQVDDGEPSAEPAANGVRHHLLQVDDGGLDRARPTMPGDAVATSQELWMWPSYPGARIHADGHERLFAGHESAGLVAEYVAKERLVVPPTQVRAGAVPLTLLVAVDSTPSEGPPRLVPMSLAEVASVIAQQVFLPRVEDRMVAIERLDAALALAPMVPGLRLVHPRTPEALPQIATALAEVLDALAPVTSAQGASSPTGDDDGDAGHAGGSEHEGSLAGGSDRTDDSTRIGGG